MITQNELVKRSQDIQLIVTDVDGVLNNGNIAYNESGSESFGTFNIHDGFGCTMAKACNLQIAVISGRKSLCTISRFKLLGIEEVYTGIIDKKQQLLDVMQQLNLTSKNIAYIGDDFVDIACMQYVNLSFAPTNAREEVKKIAHHITNASGGNGVLREVIELIVKAQNQFDKFITQYFGKE